MNLEKKVEEVEEPKPEKKMSLTRFIRKNIFNILSLTTIFFMLLAIIFYSKELIGDPKLINPENVSAYYFPHPKEGEGIVVENAFDELIDWKTFSDVSESIQDISSNLIELKYKSNKKD